jgi:UDP-N-acetylmuramoylalanine--D-glutamate ligase
VETAALRGKRFSVLGAARSGQAVAGLLQKEGVSVFVSDKAPADKMQQAAAELERMGIPYELGANSRRVLDADGLVISPGVPSTIPIVREAVARGMRVVSELEVGSWFCAAPIIAVTGTNGKTTTTTLIGEIFGRAERPAIIAGNIGRAFSLETGNAGPDSVAILEVSSFQLDHIESFRPRVAIILNITPDHLDRYEHSFEKYIASKCRIFENQREGDVLIYNWDDDVTRREVERLARPEITRLPFSIERPLESGAWIERAESTSDPGPGQSQQAEDLVAVVYGRRSRIISAGQIAIRGNHNRYNAMAASLAALAMGIPASTIASTLTTFEGVEHRLEFVRELDGVKYVNDSKATNVDSVWYALQSFDAPIVVLLGGRDKGNDYSRLRDLMKKHVRAVVAIGESADTVVQAFASEFTVRKAASMEEAVAVSGELARPGDVVLLSPACASFDWFENYEQRGRVFKDIVRNLDGKFS